MDGTHVYNEVYLDDVHIPANQVVGKDGGGWAVVNVLAGFERSNMGMVYALLSAIEGFVKYCNETKRNGVPLSHDPIIRNRMADLAIGLEAVRTLAMRIADQQSRNEMGLMDAAAVKVYASELMEKMAHVMTDLLGPYGQVKHSKFARWTVSRSHVPGLLCSHRFYGHQRNPAQYYRLVRPWPSQDEIT